MSDKIIKFLAHEGRVSVICANTTKMVEEARKTHDMSPVVTAAFGRLLTITSIMATEMKGSKRYWIKRPIYWYISISIW